MAIDPTFSDTDKQEFLEILNFSSQRLMQTVTDYMDVSLITSDNMEVIKKGFAPVEVLNEIQSLFQPQCSSKNISLIIEKQETFNSIFINSDRTLLKKVLTHLVDNAVKFTKSGSITVGVHINIGILEFYVKDTGKGINEDALSIIFEHFSQEDVTTTRDHEGSGLGLAIAKGLVTLLGGKIRAESDKDKGSTFTFTIPWIEEISDSSKPVIQTPELVVGKRPIILVAEDEPYGFMLFELSLDTDYEIIRALDGEEAVELCKLIPEIQLVLMDIKLPKMNGLKATREIKKFRNDLPIIALTAYAEAGIRERCLEAGCDEYMPKPVSKIELLNKIKEFGLAVKV